MTTQPSGYITAIVPAAGVGSRMKAGKPKQYLTIGQSTILEHTVNKLLAHPAVSQVIIAITDGDPYFPELAISENPKVVQVSGGKERADSVVSALEYVVENQLSDWVLVHDAARPCVSHQDISQLIESVEQSDCCGGILAAPVRDTMKRSNHNNQIEQTLDRSAMWHALTPQMFPAVELRKLLTAALSKQVTITDEASAFEWAGFSPLLVAGRADNIKVTQPEDLDLATFYLQRNI